MAEADYEARILRARKLFIAFAALSLVVPVLSFVPALMHTSETLDTWFQRSGSAMVVLALLAEMRAYQMFDVFKPEGLVDGAKYSAAKEKYLAQVKACNVFAFALIAIGTVIWGYGDLLIREL